MEITPQQFATLQYMADDLAKFLISLLPKTAFKIAYPTPKIYDITQGFGVNPELYKKWGFAGHFGIDFAAPHGSSIIACDDGTVSRAGFTAGNGHYVEIKHSWGYSLYLHFRYKPMVVVRQFILKGHKIGEVGNTGIVIPKPTPTNPLAGTHLHFSIKVNDKPNPEYKDWIDPEPYLAV